MHDDELEPFLLIFAVLAVVLTVVIVFARGGDDSTPVVAAPEPEPTVAEEPEPLPDPTPTPEPEPVAAPDPAAVTIDVGASPVVISGSVPDQAAKDALLAAAEAEFGADNIVDEVTIDDALTMDGSTLRLIGELDSADLGAQYAGAFGALDFGVTDDTSAVELPTLADLAAGRDDLSTVAGLLDQAGLAGVLSEEGPVTIFAPTNDALAGVPEDTLARIADDPDLLGQVLGFHVVDGEVRAADAIAAGSAVTRQGETIVITQDGDDVRASGAPISEVDLEASNGVLHIIDGVMIPPSVTGLLVEESVAATIELEPIQFAVGSAEILPASEITLAAVAQTLNENPQITVAIEGHTDNDGDPASNLQLSQDRADSVKTFLVEQGGVDESRMTTEGFGETQPIADNGTEEGRAENRRIEFIVTSS